MSFPKSTPKEPSVVVPYDAAITSSEISIVTNSGFKYVFINFSPFYALYAAAYAFTTAFCSSVKRAKSSPLFSINDFAMFATEFFAIVSE